eukprot:g18296.t1
MPLGHHSCSSYSLLEELKNWEHSLCPHLSFCSPDHCCSSILRYHFVPLYQLDNPSRVGQPCTFGIHRRGPECRGIARIRSPGSKSPTNIFSLGRSCLPRRAPYPAFQGSRFRPSSPPVASGTRCFVDPLLRLIINWCVWRLSFFLVLLSPSLAFIDRRPFIRPRPYCDDACPCPCPRRTTACGPIWSSLSPPDTVSFSRCHLSPCPTLASELPN